ncbi:MAG: hypothetical protein KJO79_09030 [Verrucomicrobiae bacterium]|nr:hypothetical protein [Verrucomicrobiae bacterium]NNJ87312.1 hypothetical protein [Akkermansiaceae bacterium]
MPAQSKPMKVTLDVNTKARTEPVKNRLMGYNIMNYRTKKQRDLVRQFDPVAMRFPCGVWGNFYDWETDTFTNHGDKHHKTKTYAPTLANWKKIGYKGGFPGLALLNKEKKKASGKGLDIVWLYNAAYDSPAQNVARMRDSIKKGFIVRDIELGNEQFWLNQCSSKTITPEGYHHAASTITRALKKANPELRMSITLSWREKHDKWNKIVAGDGKYFDAISLHKYSGFNEDKKDPKAQQQALKGALTARLWLKESANYVRSFGPGKPIWMTEWGVNAGKGAKAAAALAMADCYLYMFENQDVFDRANWFSVNGVSRSFLVFKEKRRLLYPLQKTAYACIHEIVRSVFEDSQLLTTRVNSPKLNLNGHTMDAVSARAVTQAGQTKVIAVNLSGQPSQLTLRFDNQGYQKPITHHAMAFKDLSDLVVLALDTNPLQPISNTPGSITLPPYSVSVLSGFDKNGG